jgi:tetratricopeptide (TPR) repeat protein
MRPRLTCILFFLITTAPAAIADSVSDLIDHGHYKRAEVVLRQQLQQNPNDPLANCLMSKVDVAFARYDDAISHAEKAVAADGNNGKYHAQLEDALGAKTSDPAAGMFKKMSAARRMKDEAAIALRLDAKSLDANEDLLEFYLEAPGIVGGGLDKAKELADRVALSDPGLAFYLQAHIAQHEKRTEEAQRFFQQYIQAAPDHYDAYVELANLYLNQNPPQFPQAEERGRQGIKIDPQRVGAYAVLAVVDARQSRWKDLDQLLSDSEKNIPDDFAPHYQAGKFIFLSGDGQQLSRAEACFRKYLTQQPEAGTPSLAAAHWRLALVLEKQGHKDDARAELQAAVKLGPNLKEAQQDLKRLK